MPPESAVVEDEQGADASRRRFQRVRLTLLGRFMLENRREYPCQTVDMSPGSCALIAPVLGAIGERVVVYIDHIGRVEGRVARLFDGGFALTFESGERKRDKLASKLTWLANRYHLNLAEDRRHERLTPTHSKATLNLPDGRQYEGSLVDLSLSGASLGTDYKPPIGSQVRVGKIRAVVVRHTEDGVAVEFAVLQTAESLEEGLAPKPAEKAPAPTPAEDDAAVAAAEGESPAAS
jgi:hypothetical protein